MRQFRAPGRVNLIGEHTDYNDGFVLPAAIGFYTTAKLDSSPRGFEVSSTSLPGTIRVQPGGDALEHTGEWYDYVLGVAAELEQLGVLLPSIRLEFSSDIPMGAGLSSSAALLVSSALAILAYGGHELSKMDIARACQLAEINFVGTRCGIMDQFISMHGVAGHAVLLDCRSLDFRAVPIPDGLSLVIANTMVKHSLAGGEYNQRRVECERAAKALGVRSLRDAKLEDLHVLPELEQKRARHIVSENARVLQFVEALAAGDLAALGELMAASHASLRDDYAVSCKELDVMVEAAQGLPGLVGARMTGGGFGGATINLVKTEQAPRFASALAARYEQITGITAEVYITKAVDGAAEVSAA